MLAIYLRNVRINLLILLPLLFLLVLLVRWVIEGYVWSLEPAVRQEGSLGEDRVLFYVFISGVRSRALRSVIQRHSDLGPEMDPPEIQVGAQQAVLGGGLASDRRGGAGCTILPGGAECHPRIGGVRFALVALVAGAWAGTFLGRDKSPMPISCPRVCLLLHALLFGVPLCLISLFQLLRRGLSGAAPKQRSAGFGLIGATSPPSAGIRRWNPDRRDLRTAPIHRVSSPG